MPGSRRPMPPQVPGASPAGASLPNGCALRHADREGPRRRFNGGGVVRAGREDDGKKIDRATKNAVSAHAQRGQRPRHPSMSHHPLYLTHPGQWRNVDSDRRPPNTSRESGSAIADARSNSGGTEAAPPALRRQQETGQHVMRVSRKTRRHRRRRVAPGRERGSAGHTDPCSFLTSEDALKRRGGRGQCTQSKILVVETPAAQREGLTRTRPLRVKAQSLGHHRLARSPLGLCRPRCGARGRRARMRPGPCPLPIEHKMQRAHVTVALRRLAAGHRPPGVPSEAVGGPAVCHLTRWPGLPPPGAPLGRRIRGRDHAFSRRRAQQHNNTSARRRRRASSSGDDDALAATAAPATATTAARAGPHHRVAAQCSQHATGGAV
jgi:hypothetical protein